MTEDQINEFLVKPNIARLATVKPDGSPFSVPVWYEWDNDDKCLYIVGRRRSSWIENIRHEPRVCVLIDSSEPPYPKVLIEGIANIIGFELKDWIDIGKKMSNRYLEEGTGSKYLEGSMDQPRCTIRISPKTITTWVSVPDSELQQHPRLDWPSKYYEPGTRWYDEYLAEKMAKQRQTS